MDKIFHNIRNNIPEPDKAWLNQSRGFLLARYKAKHSSDIQTRQSRLLWYNFIDSLSVARQLALKPIAITAALLIVIFGGPLLVVMASQDDLPGDKLYSVKQITHSFKRYLSVTKDNQVKLEMAFVGSSLADLNKMINRTKLTEGRGEQNTNKIKLAVEVVKKNVESLQRNFETQSGEAAKDPKFKEKAVALARLVTQERAGINKKLSETKQKLTSPEVVQTEAAQTIQEIEEVEDKLAQTNIDALKVLAQEHEDLEDNAIQGVISRQELASLVKAEILNAKNKIAKLDTEEDVEEDLLKDLIEEQTKNVESKLREAEILVYGNDFVMAMANVEEASHKIKIVKDIIKKVVDLSAGQPADDVEPDGDSQVVEEVDPGSNATSTQEDSGEVKGESTASREQSDLEEERDENIKANTEANINLEENNQSNDINQAQSPMPIDEESTQAVEEDNNIQKEEVKQEYQIKIGE